MVFSIVAGIEMATIKIDDKEYEIDSLPQEAKNQLVSLQFVDNEPAKLQAQMGAMQTSRMAYARALQESLPKFERDTIKVG